MGAATRYLEARVPDWADGTPFSRIADSIEFPVYAIALGLLGNVVLTRLAVREALAGGFRTEFFIKTGLMLLGASVNLKVLVTAAGPAIVQALLLISIVFGFTWWLGGRVGLDAKLRALLASAVSICGVSAAIAAIVKTTQNALIGFVAIALTAYFALRVERDTAARPTIGQFWQRFPKFVVGFVAASVIGTLYLAWGGDKADIATINDLRTWFLIFAFVAIGLEFSVKGLREAGRRPVAVFGSATVVNIVVALGLAVVLFGGVDVG